MLRAQAMSSSFRGDREGAARILEQVRLEHRSRGNADVELNVTILLAEVEHARGRTHHAIALGSANLCGLRRMFDIASLVNQLANLAGYYAAVDDFPRAVEAVREALGLLAVRDPDNGEVAILIEHLALVYALRGAPEKAAILEGFANASFPRRAFLREFTEIGTHLRLDGLLRDSLPADELVLLAAEGAAFQPDAAIAFALEDPPQVSEPITAARKADG
jgi:hypothetical protein